MADGFTNAPEDSSEPAARGRRSAGRSLPAQEQVPAFGPGELYGEIDSAEKLVGEIDRQIRGNQGVRNVVRRHGASGSVSHEAGADLLSQAAVGESILGYTETVAGRNGIRTGSRAFNANQDQAPLTHTHTRLVNVAVVERKNASVFDDDKFEVQEATIVPKKAGLSILMFDLCCANGRQQSRPKKASPAALDSSGPEYIDPSQWDRKPAAPGWDPKTDYHLTRETEEYSSPHSRVRRDEPLRLVRVNRLCVPERALGCWHARAQQHKRMFSY